jgi:hypothetical protein
MRALVLWALVALLTLATSAQDAATGVNPSPVAISASPAPLGAAAGAGAAAATEESADDGNARSVPVAPVDASAVGAAATPVDEELAGAWTESDEPSGAGVKSAPAPVASADAASGPPVGDSEVEVEGEDGGPQASAAGAVAVPDRAVDPPDLRGGLVDGWTGKEGESADAENAPAATPSTAPASSASSSPAASGDLEALPTAAAEPLATEETAPSPTTDPSLRGEALARAEEQERDAVRRRLLEEEEAATAAAATATTPTDPISTSPAAAATSDTPRAASGSTAPADAESEDASSSPLLPFLLTCPLLHPVHDDLARLDTAIALTAPVVARCKVEGDEGLVMPDLEEEGAAAASTPSPSSPSSPTSPHVRCARAEADLLAYQRARSNALTRRLAYATRAGLGAVTPVERTPSTAWSGEGFPLWFLNFTVRGSPALLLAADPLPQAPEPAEASAEAEEDRAAVYIRALARSSCARRASGCSVLSGDSAADDEASLNATADALAWLRSPAGLRLPGFLSGNLLPRLPLVAAAAAASGPAATGGHGHHAHPRGADESVEGDDAAQAAALWATRWPVLRARELGAAATSPAPTRFPAGLHGLLAPLTPRPIVVRLYDGSTDLPLLYPRLDGSFPDRLALFLQADKGRGGPQWTPMGPSNASEPPSPSPSTSTPSPVTVAIIHAGLRDYSSARDGHALLHKTRAEAMGRPLEIAADVRGAHADLLLAPGLTGRGLKRVLGREAKATTTAAAAADPDACPLEFPGALLANAWEVVVRPGEALLVPSGYAFVWREAGAEEEKDAAPEVRTGAGDAPVPTLVLEHAFVDASNVQAVVAALLSSPSTPLTPADAALLDLLETGLLLPAPAAAAAAAPAAPLLDVRMPRFPAQHALLADLIAAPAAASQDEPPPPKAEEEAAPAAAADADVSPPAPEPPIDAPAPEPEPVQAPGETAADFRRRKRKWSEKQKGAGPKPPSPPTPASPAGGAAAAGGGVGNKQTRLREWQEEQAWQELLRALARPAPLHPLPLTWGRDNVTLAWHLPPVANGSFSSSSTPAYVLYYHAEPLADSQARMRAVAQSDRFRATASAAAEAEARRAFAGRRLGALLSSRGRSGAAGSRATAAAGEGEEHEPLTTVLGDGTLVTIHATGGELLDPSAGSAESAAATETTGSSSADPQHGNIRGLSSESDGAVVDGEPSPSPSPTPSPPPRAPLVITVSADGSLNLGEFVGQAHADAHAEALENPSRANASIGGGRGLEGVWGLAGGKGGAAAARLAMWEDRLDAEVREAARRLRSIAWEIAGEHSRAAGGEEEMRDPSSSSSDPSAHPLASRRLAFARRLPEVALEWLGSTVLHPLDGNGAVGTARAPSSRSGRRLSSAATTADRLASLGLRTRATAAARRRLDEGGDPFAGVLEDERGGHPAFGARLYAVEEADAADGGGGGDGREAGAGTPSPRGSRGLGLSLLGPALSSIRLPGAAPAWNVPKTDAATEGDEEDGAADPSPPHSPSPPSAELLDFPVVSIGCGSPVAHSPSTASSACLTVRSLLPAHSYSFRIAAVSDDGTVGVPSPPSAPISTLPLTLPPPLTGPPFAFADDVATVRLEWSSVLPPDTGGLPLLGLLVTRQDTGLDGAAGPFAHPLVLPATVIGQSPRPPSRASAGHGHTSSSPLTLRPASGGSITGLSPNTTYRFRARPITALGVGLPSPATRQVTTPPLHAPKQEAPGGRLLAVMAGRGRLTRVHHGEAGANASLDHGISTFDPSSPAVAGARAADRLAVVAQLHAAVSVALDFLRSAEEEGKEGGTNGTAGAGNTTNTPSLLRASELLERSGLGEGAEEAAGLDEVTSDTQTGGASGAGSAGQRPRRATEGAGGSAPPAGAGDGGDGGGLGHSLGLWFDRTAVAEVAESGVERVVSEPVANPAVSGAEGEGDGTLGAGLLPGLGGRARFAASRQARIRALEAARAQQQKMASGTEPESPRRQRRRRRLVDADPVDAAPESGGDGEGVRQGGAAAPSSKPSPSWQVDAAYWAMANGRVSDFVRALADAYEGAAGGARGGSSGGGGGPRPSSLLLRGLTCEDGLCSSPAAAALRRHMDLAEEMERLAEAEAGTSAGGKASTGAAPLPCISPLVVVSDANQTVTVYAPRPGAPASSSSLSSSWTIPGWTSAWSPRTYDVQGEVVAAQPLTGRPAGQPRDGGRGPVSSTPFLDNEPSAVAGRIVLLERGAPLAMADKVRAAAALGASAVVLVDDEEGRCGTERNPSFTRACVQGGKGKEAGDGFAAADAPEAWGRRPLPVVLVPRDAGLRLRAMLYG